MNGNRKIFLRGVTDMYDENKHDEYEDQNHETYSNYKKIQI